MSTEQLKCCCCGHVHTSAARVESRHADRNGFRSTHCPVCQWQNFSILTAIPAPAPVKKMGRSRIVGEVEQLANESKFAFAKKLWEAGESDFVTVHGTFAGARLYVLYSSYNGRFFGTTYSNLPFSSDSADYDNEAWFIAILEFFYLQPDADNALETMPNPFTPRKKGQLERELHKQQRQQQEAQKAKLAAEAA